MKIVTGKIELKTRGQGDIVDITSRIRERLEESKLREGQATIFVPGSTAGIVTLEHEPGLIKDLRRLYDSLAPAGADYAHHATWGDDNGSSHVRAAIQGPSLTIPFEDGKLTLGTWQQVALAEFDTRPRERGLVLQLIGRPPSLVS